MHVNQKAFGALDVELFREGKGNMHDLLLSFLSFYFLSFIAETSIKKEFTGKHVYFYIF